MEETQLLQACEGSYGERRELGSRLLVEARCPFLWEASGSERAEDFNNTRIFGRTAGVLKASDQAG